MDRRPNPDEWRVIDFDSKYAAGHAYNRLMWLFKYDPFVSLFDVETQRALAHLFFTAEVLGNEDIKIRTNHEIYAYVSDALDKSPFGLLISHQFKAHLIGLIHTAMFGGKEENGVLS